MKMSEIRQRAKGLGVKAGRIRKPELIRAIQRAEGHFDCFGSTSTYCDQQSCCWREDCLGKKA